MKKEALIICIDLGDRTKVVLQALKYGGWCGYICENYYTFPPFIVDIYGKVSKKDANFIHKYDLPVNLKEEEPSKSILSKAKLTLGSDFLEDYKALAVKISKVMGDER